MATARGPQLPPLPPDVPEASSATSADRITFAADDSPSDARAMHLKRRYFTQPPPPEVAGLRDLRASGPHGPIPLRLYRPFGPPDTAVLPVLVYYHGGGHVIGDLETHDRLCRELANLAGCAVVAVDYRLGPEHCFPGGGGRRDAALKWLRHSNAAISHYIDSGPSWRLEHMLGASAIPVTVLVDAKGRVVARIRGARDWDSAESIQLLERAFAGHGRSGSSFLPRQPPSCDFR